MRMLPIAALTVFAVMFDATHVNRPAAIQLARANEFHQASIVIDQLTANAKNLPVQAFDTF
jgi:hypothetical protein